MTEETASAARPRMIHVPFFDVSEEDELDLLDAISALVYAENGWQAAPIGSQPWEPDSDTLCGDDAASTPGGGAQSPWLSGAPTGSTPAENAASATAEEG